MQQMHAHSREQDHDVRAMLALLEGHVAPACPQDPPRQHESVQCGVEANLQPQQRLPLGQAPGHGRPSAGNERPPAKDSRSRDHRHLDGSLQACMLPRSRCWLAGASRSNTHRGSSTPLAARDLEDMQRAPPCTSSGVIGSARLAEELTRPQLCRSPLEPLSSNCEGIHRAGVGSKQSEHLQSRSGDSALGGAQGAVKGGQSRSSHGSHKRSSAKAEALSREVHSLNKELASFQTATA